MLTRAQPDTLVDASGHAHITDFCLATVTQNLESKQSSSGGPGRTGRWTGLEILNQRRHNNEADVFSFALVMIEVRPELAVWIELGLPPAHTTTGIYWRSSVR